MKQFRLVRVAEQCVKEREKIGRSPNALSYEQLGSCADFLLNQTRNLLSKKALHKNINKIQETYVQACENSSDLPTGKFKRKLSHLGQIVNMRIEHLLWALAHLSL